MAVVNTLQQLNTGILPPGTSQAFRDYLVRLGSFTQEAGDTANNAEGSASDAFTIAEQQRIRNDQQDNEIDNLEGQVSSLATRVTEAENQVDTLAQQVEAFDSIVIKNNVDTLQIMDGPLSIGTEIRVNNVKVMGGRQTGWTAQTGTTKKGGIDGSAAYAVGGAYSQAEVQALADGLVEARQVIAALVALALSHGYAGT
ncbi:hypothetical protein sortregn_43 [Escherichia phage sortregn]|nr:hypothetical protein sortregn_43 [Escherichia phage sortregn]